MIGVGFQAQLFTQGQPNQIREGMIPAPVKGVDARSSVAEMDSRNCFFAYNILPAEFGCEVRPGFREWQISIENTTGLGVKTLMPFDGPTASKLFAATNEGIWDVTTDGGTPSRKATFTADTTANSGHGVSLTVINSAVETMFYADSLNGLWEYTPSTNTWAAKTNITGVAETDICFIMKHKQRIWLIEKDQASAWYLGIDAVSGAATEFFFGNKFPHGGTLKALVNWSVDGGNGVDDMLVAISSSGDVVVYQGSDPGTLESASSAGGWSVVGTYFIGAVPAGRRCFSEYSGQLYLLSSFGFISMSDLLRGVDITSQAAQSLAYPIASILRKAIAASPNSLGWEPVFLPQLGTLLIAAPQTSEGVYLQYAMNLSVQGWGFWRGVPIDCVAEWNNKVYIGTSDNRVFVLENTRDYVLLDTGDPDYLGSPVTFSLLTAYSDAGSPARYKMPAFVRPNFQNIIPAALATRVFFDYEVGEQIFSIGAATPSDLALWDTALWDQGLWAGDTLTPQSPVQGSSGMGRVMAIALRGEATDQARLVSFEVLWKQAENPAL